MTTKYLIRRAIAIGLVFAILATLGPGPTPAEATGRGWLRHSHARVVPSSGDGHDAGGLIASNDRRETVADAADVTAAETEIAAGDVACEGNDDCLDSEPWLRGQDRVYLVDTRCLDCPCGKEVPDLPIYRYDTVSVMWQPSSIEELAGDCDDAVASIHVHGNRIDQYTSVARGWAVYHEWVRRDPGETRLVFIIWSWPSTQIHGPIKDVRSKAARTAAESFFLAHLISGLPPQTPVSLTGHSFGARIICGAAHLVAGGNLGGYRLLPGRVGPPRQLHAVLTAAAMHDYWLSPGCYNGRALSEIDRLLVLYNTCDPVLRYYRHIERGARPQAMGYTGAVICSDTEARVDQVNVACQVGKEHSFLAYLCNAAVIDLAAPYVLFQPTDSAE